MKKLSIYMMMLSAVMWTACDEDFNKDIASPQSYGQEEAASKITFAATGVAAINLGAVTEDSVTVGTFTAPDVQDAVFSYKMKLDGKATVAVDAKGRVATEDLQNAVAQIYGIRPVEREMEAALTAYVSLDKAVYAASAEAYTLKVTPKAPVIEGAYYINGTLTWNENVAFGNASGDPYTNSVFTVTVPAVITEKAPAKDAYFRIQSASGKWLGAVEAEDDALEGNLLVSETANPIKVAGGDYKSVKISIDMMEGTYKVEKLADAPYLWVAGDYQGWNPSAAPTLLKPEGEQAYWGMVELNGGYKFTAQPYWPNDSNGGIDYGYYYFTNINGDISNGDTNLSSPQGLYYFVVNLNDTYVSATKITSMNLVGSVINDWDTGLDMPYNESEKCWTVTAELKVGEFKLRINSSWDTSFAGTLDAINPFATGNIALDASGTYTVKLYLNGRLVLIKE